MVAVTGSCKAPASVTNVAISAPVLIYLGSWYKFPLGSLVIPRVNAFIKLVRFVSLPPFAVDRQS